MAHVGLWPAGAMAQTGALVCAVLEAPVREGRVELVGTRDQGQEPGLTAPRTLVRWRPHTR